MLHKTIDAIATFCGTALFLLLNIVFYSTWLLLNTLSPFQFDKYPFQAMTTVLSIEAILLTVFVLISQNRQGERDREAAKADHLLNMKEEREQCEMLTILANQNTAQDEHQRLLSESHAILQEMRELAPAKRARK